MPRESYSSLRIQTPVAADFRRLVRQLSATADCDLTQSEALAALLSLGLADVLAVAEHLPVRLRSANGVRMYAAEPGEAAAGQTGPMAPSEASARLAGAGSETRTDDARD